MELFALNKTCGVQGLVVRSCFLKWAFVLATAFSSRRRAGMKDRLDIDSPPPKQRDSQGEGTEWLRESTGETVRGCSELRGKW